MALKKKYGRDSNKRIVITIGFNLLARSNHFRLSSRSRLQNKVFLSNGHSHLPFKKLKLNITIFVTKVMVSKTGINDQWTIRVESTITK